MTKPPQTRRAIPLGQFVQEILDDLPELFEGYPKGIFMSTLTGYYGESSARVLSAIRILEVRNKLRVCKTANRKYYITQPNLTGTPLDDLTPVQRTIFYTLDSSADQQRQVTTSYTQLARVANISYGGCRTAVTRLHTLEFIEVLSEPKRGLQNTLKVHVKFNPAARTDQKMPLD